MSKMGDLIVRLKLQYDDYKKGLKKASADTTSFGGTLGKIKGVGLAVWGAIGVATVKFAKDVITSTNRTGDAWDKFIAKSKAGWNTFLQTLSSWDWDNWTGRINEATKAAERLQSALDASFEIKNSIELQKAAMAEELANLQILMRDVSKPWEVRAKAAQDYLDKVSPIYQQEIDLANKLLDAQQGKWLAGTGLADTEQTRADLMRFLVDIGKDENLANNLAQYVSAQDIIDKGVNKFGTNYSKVNKAYEQRGVAAGNIAAARSQYDTDIVALFRAYNNIRSDKDTAPLVQAAINAGQARAAEGEETRRVRAVINQAQAAAQQELESFNTTLANDLQAGLDAAFAEIDSFDDSFADIELEIPEIKTDALDKGLQEIQENAEKYRAVLDEVAQYNGMLEDSIIQATTGGMQAFTDMLAGIEGADASDILAALLQPFANTATQLGSLLLAEGIGIKAFKESLEKLNPAVAIGAGAALIALGAALGSAIKALGTGGSGGASATNGGYSSGSSGSSAKYSPELTIKIQGKLRGSDIVMSEENTLQKWGR